MVATGPSAMPSLEFADFVARFPLTTDGQPPRKKARVDAGFSDDQVFYDKWRAAQYAEREKYLLCKFCSPYIQHYLPNERIGQAWHFI